MNKARMIRTLMVAAILLLCLSFAQSARADSFTTIPEFNGPINCTDPCGVQPAVLVGTVDILAGDTSITISGTFGNTVVGNSSGVELFLGSILVAQCVEFTTCWTSSTPTAWSDTITGALLASLSTGVVDFTEVQTSQHIVRLGVTTIDQVAPAGVPEPSTWLLLGSGVLAFLGFARKRALLEPCA